MSQIEISEENGILKIWNHRERVNEADIQAVNAFEMKTNKVYTSYVKITKNEDRNQIFYFNKYEYVQPEEDFAFEDSENVAEDLENLEEEVNQEEQEPEESELDNEISNDEKIEYILVYSDGKKIKYTKGRPEVLLKRLLPFKVRVLKLAMNKKRLHICSIGYFVNKYLNLEVGKQDICVSDLTCECQFPIKERNTNILKILLQGGMQRTKFLLSDILQSTATINSGINAEIEINGFKVSYGLPKRKRKITVSKKYFVPCVKTIRDGMMLFIRRNARGNIILVIRPADTYELTKKYLFWENRVCSCILYYLGRAVRIISRKKVNLYFEKETLKAEEGTYEVFSLANKLKSSHNYYVIDANSDDFDRICNNKNVVTKYSAKYYWLLYRADNAITTEAPAHLNILRSGNKYIRLRMIELRFVFLQHGVTYMKCHGRASAFVAGREAEPRYIFVGSKKERDVVVDMLHLPEERVLNTGLPIFSTIPYKHIMQSSDDYVTIMLTFKPYEERLDDFENSRYYHAILEIYDILKRYISEDKILIVAHPRIHYLLETTSLKERMWNRPISDVLEITKLMITDYSSVAYNSFYQGAAVLFYQEDIVEYELACGGLIPTEEEYIGFRAFSLEELEEAIVRIIQNGKVVLNAARTSEHERNYNTINEFHDGKNIERIYDKLVELNLI
ncbi:MAG: hypothetical protein HFI76_00055 [Lachnospiraceae bacterium]|nr:hypothetical protein [Lachnospiraceae bacterium]